MRKAQLNVCSVSIGYSLARRKSRCLTRTKGKRPFQNWGNGHGCGGQWPYGQWPFLFSFSLITHSLSVAAPRRYPVLTLTWLTGTWHQLNGGVPSPFGFSTPNGEALLRVLETSTYSLGIDRADPIHVWPCIATWSHIHHPVRVYNNFLGN